MKFRSARLKRIGLGIAMTIAVLGGMSFGTHAAAQTLTGTVSSQVEGVMEGVLVSAKLQGSTITTTVVSNADGVYSFPSDRLSPGTYDVSIRAVGFVLPGSRHTVAVNVGESGTTFDIELQEANLLELAYQLIDPEWLLSYPLDEQTKYNTFLNCNRCHTLRRPSMSTWNEEQAAWILKRMAYSSGSSAMTFQLSAAQTPVFGRAEWGQPSPANRQQGNAMAAINLSNGLWQYDLVTLPRPTGEATQVIYTTWDLPVTARPHDTRMGLDGYLYFNHFNDNAIGRLNLETGEVQEWRWPYGATQATNSQFSPTGARTIMGPDAQNRFYIGNQAQGGLVRFDPATETFEFANPPGNGGEMVEVTNMHVDGYAWISAGGRASRLDVDTWEVVETFSGQGRSLARYDIASTSDNSLFGGSRGTSYIWRLDAQTGDVQYWDIPPEPRSQGGLGTGMRRGIVDDQDRLWWGGYDGNFVGMVDPSLPEGEQLRIWPMPFPYFWPYDAQNDGQGYTWTGGQTADHVARLDEETDEWIFYLLPFETDIRNIDLKPAAPGVPSGLWVGGTHEGHITLIEPITGRTPAAGAQQDQGPETAGNGQQTAVANGAVQNAGSITFTAQQAELGKALYENSACIDCHASTLEGGGGPPLKGAVFQAWFRFGNPAELFDLLSTTMPIGDPGSLEAEEYAAILAYILRENGLSPSGQELPASLPALSTMSFPAP